MIRGNLAHGRVYRPFPPMVVRNTFVASDSVDGAMQAGLTRCLFDARVLGVPTAITLPYLSLRCVSSVSFTERTAGFEIG